MNETHDIYGRINGTAGREEIQEAVDEFKEIYKYAGAMPKIELWERDKEVMGSMEYKEDITLR
jgi:hypothetical protein